MGSVRFLLIIVLLLLPAHLWADIHVADSCSVADLTTQQTAASTGDVVQCTGNAAWTGTFTLSKGITLEGIGTPVISIDDTVTGVTITSPAADFVRVTGFHFQYPATSNTSTRKAVWVSSGFANTNFRIDHNTMENASHSVFVSRLSYGVIDSNTFLNTYVAVGYNGPDDGANVTSWNTAIAAGTANAVFIENNTITLNADYAHTATNELIFPQYGARLVARYNTVDGTALTTKDTIFFDDHGNQNGYYHASNSSAMRGQPITEVYNNSVHVYRGVRQFHVRGGSVLIHDNAVVNDTQTPYLMFVEQEAWSQFHFASGAAYRPVNRASWPAEDQVTNSFVWGNTFNGTAITDGNYTTYIKYAYSSANCTASGNMSGETAGTFPCCTGAGTGTCDDSTFIRKDYEFFLHAPAAMGGKSSYTNRPGAAGSSPTDGIYGAPDFADTGTMTFSASGANAYYPYTPYTCPHPLAGLSGVCNTKAGVDGYNQGTVQLGVGAGVTVGVGAGQTLY